MPVAIARWKLVIVEIIVAGAEPIEALALDCGWMDLKQMDYITSATP